MISLITNFKISAEGNKLLHVGRDSNFGIDSFIDAGALASQTSGQVFNSKTLKCTTQN